MTLTYSKPAVQNAWADSAVPTTDIIQPTNTFVEGGWLQSTIPPARQYFNWALFWPSAGIRYFCQRGIVDWDTNELYYIGAYVQYGTNGIVWVSVYSGYQSGITPGSNGAYWQQAFVTPSGLATSLAPYATTSYVNGTFLTISSFNSQIAAYATLASPTLTGTPAAPTAAFSTNTTQIASTAFVQQALSGATGSGNLVGNGYWVSPFGLIIMWGVAPGIGGQGNISVTFPKSGGFPTACFSITLEVIGGAQFTYLNGNPGSNSTGFSVAVGGGYGFSWIAVGH